jgi:hypothetical protein
VLLTTACADDDDSDPSAPGSETEIDGGEVDGGGADEGTSTSGGTTSGGTAGNQEVDEPGEPEPTTEATADAPD